ncbi:MAG: hypothetical protein WAV30_00045 [Microgenomates group bacterium]
MSKLISLSNQGAGSRELSRVPYIPSEGASIGTAYLHAARELLPFFSRRLTGMGLILNEKVTKAGQLEPEEFWSFMVSQITHGKYGEGKHKPTTKEIKNFYNEVVGSLHDRGWSDYASRFIEVGREMLLSGFDREHVNEREREELRDYYKDLILDNENLADGRKQYWHNITANIADEAAKETGSMIPNMFIGTRTGIENATYGIGGTHPFTVEDGRETKSIIEVELKAFLESDAYQELPSKTRYQIMNAAKRQLLEGLRTQVDGRAALSLGRVFADVAKHTIDTAYFDTQVNSLTERFDLVAKHRLGDDEIERRKLAKSDQLHAELTMWVDMISNPGYGLGGKSEEATSAIAGVIGGLFSAYERRANVSLQAGMFEVVQEKLLDAYKKTKNPAIRDLYKNTAEAVFTSVNPEVVTGQTDFYDQQIETPESTKAFLDKLVARIQDADYGADAGQFSLADTFVKQAKDLISRAKRQGNDKQAQVYEVTVDKIKATIREARTLDTTVVKKLGEIHHAATDELKGAFSTSESQSLFTSVTETGLTEEIFGKGKLYAEIAKKIEETGEISSAEYNVLTQNGTLQIGGRLAVFIQEHGKITKDELNTLRVETNNQLVEQPLIEFWNTYISDIVDKKFGHGGLHTASVKQILEDTKAHFTSVKDTVKLLAPEMQQKFIEVGFKQLLLWLDSTDITGGILPLSVANLDTKQKHVVADEFNSFVQETLKRESDGKPTFVEGMVKFYFDQASDPEFGKRLVSHIQNPHYGIGSEFNVVQSLMLQVDGMINLLKPMKKEQKPEEVKSAFPEICYKLLTNVQDAIKTAIDSASTNEQTIKSLSTLKTLFGRISEVLGADAAEYAAEKLSLSAVLKGDVAQKAKEKSADTLREQLKALGTGSDQADEKEKLQKEIDEIMGSAVIEGVEAAQNEFGNYWRTYLALKYEGNTTQGNQGDLSVIADSNHEKFMDALKTRDFRYVGAFLRAGVDEMFKALDKVEDPDLRQRMAFEFFNFLSVSPVAIELAAREKRRAGENEYQGAKSVRTIGSIQVEFIKRIIDESVTNRNRLGDFTTYIETNLAEKNVIPKEKLLCIELLFSYRYAKFGRTFAGKNPYEGKDVNSLEAKDVDFGQDPKSISNATHGLESSIETSSKMIKKGDRLSILEQIAAWGNFSPRILMELAVTGEMRTRLIKNKRKFGQSKWNKVREQVYNLLRDEKKDDRWYEKLNKVYKATGKYLFNADTETSVSPALTKIILNALDIPLSDKPEDSKNALELVLAFLDDFGQVATLPGTSFMFDKDWTTLDGDKRSAWESFAYNLIHQIEDLEMSGPATGANEAQRTSLADVNAAHLVLLGKAFKDFGENEDVKAVGTIGSAYVNLLHDILTDNDKSGAYKYHEDIRLAAQHVLQNELPLWSDEMMHKFFDGFVAKANSYGDYIKWIEHHNWTGIAFGAGVVPEHTYIGDLLRGQTESSEAASQLIYTKSSRMAVDATLEMLRGYMFLGGRGGKRMAISIVTNEDTDQFKDKIRGVMKVDQEGNFIEQAVRITYALGDEEQKKEMKKILEDLGRKDLSTYIATFNQDEIPGNAQKYLSKTGGLMDELAGELTVIEKKYEEALKTMMGGLKPLIRIENGQVVSIEGLGQDSVLLAQLKARGEGWISELEAKMDIQGKRDQMKSAADLEKILKERGSFAVFEEMVKQARISGGGENFEVKVIESMQEFLHVLTETAKKSAGKGGNMTQPNMFQVSRNQTGAVLSAIQSGAEAMASSLAKIVNITMEQRTEVMAKFAEIMQKTGLGESSTSVETLVKTYVDMFTKIISGDADQVEKIMGMRTAVAEKRGLELQSLLAIEEKLTNEMSALGEKADRIAIDQIKAEIDGLKSIRDQVYKAAGDAVEELKTYGDVTKAYGKNLDQRLAASAEEKTAALQFFHNVSAPNGKLGKRAFKYMQWFAGYAAAGETLNFEHLSLDPVVLLNNMGLKDYQQEDLFSQTNAQ